ncbi:MULTISPECIES: hypothetical protein [Dermacoccus]|uniref:Uncharacterized protein n=2 Tax=Dermacoccus TaxID=57495 RepID=A0A417Z170_9MICO|nr:hypothetical protein [Dermacoccus abyssi]RHW44234.1 hypothetical protein D1832_13245 [Dermacoccus abyssi]
MRHVRCGGNLDEQFLVTELQFDEREFAVGVVVERIVRDGVVHLVRIVLVELVPDFLLDFLLECLVE